jgi:type II secretory pathway pseudopilin PulG
MAWMARPTRAGSRKEAGFTLAGVIVIMTILMVFVAYTVPRQWSTVTQRDRELQTIFIMKQYARAIHDFSRKNGNALPVSIDQLKKAKLPRFIRGKNAEYVDPLTGEVDWMIIPASSAPTGPTIPGTSGTGATTTSGTTSTTGTTGTSGTSPSTGQNQTTVTIPAIPMKDYAGGPFIGIRPGKTGKSFLAFNGAENYEQWTYTVTDYRAEMNARITAAAKLWQ